MVLNIVAWLPPVPIQVVDAVHESMLGACISLPGYAYVVFSAQHPVTWNLVHATCMVVFNQVGIQTQYTGA